MLLIVRRIGAALLVIAAALVWFLMAPEASTKSFANLSDHSSDIAAALADDATNNLSAQGAPQQAVVNGWTARDLLTVIAKQSDELAQQNVDIAEEMATPEPRDLRPTAMLGLVVIGVALTVGTTSSTSQKTPKRSKALPE